MVFTGNIIKENVKIQNTVSAFCMKIRNEEYFHSWTLIMHTYTIYTEKMGPYLIMIMHL